MENGRADRKIRIGKRVYPVGNGQVYLMGILNVTPDSFSDGGEYLRPELALQHALQMAEEGADIIDIGAESTRPGYQPVSEEEETERLCRVIELLKKESDIPISVDTYKAKVMDAALSAGADLANDIWGLRYEEMHLQPDTQNRETMAEVIARHGCPAVLMHNDLMGRDEGARTTALISASHVSDEAEDDPVRRVREGMDRTLALADAAGIDRDRLILDPGIGFAKSNRESLILLDRLKDLKRKDECWLLAASRKSVIGDAIGLPVTEREEGTLVTTILAAEAGFSFVRVHAITPNLRAIRMLQAVRAQSGFHNA